MSVQIAAAFDVDSPVGSTSELPYSGITIVSIEQAVAAPFATRQLADLGARVIKIERPGNGDFVRGQDETVHGQSSYFVWLNRSKESLTLDLKAEEGQKVLHDLLVGADIFVQNLGPGAAARMGLDPANLSSRYGDLISCEITGFGSAGPWRDRKGHDLLVQAECGLMSITSSPTAVAKTAISVAGIVAGMYAFSGLQSSLYVRATTGRTRAVSVSLFDALAEWMGSPAYYTRYGGVPPERVGARHATIAPYGPYSARDDASVVIAIQNDREWDRFCRSVVGDAGLAEHPDYARNSDRVRNSVALNLRIANWFTTVTAGEATRLLADNGIAYADLNTMEQFLDHPVLRGRWCEVATPGGPIDALAPPAVLSGVEPRMDAVPEVGEHTEQILRSLGRDQAEIDRLRAARIV
jgi:itaconate CoA-transferase